MRPDQERTAEGGRVLCVAGWWPGPNDVNGIFIREHVTAIAQARDVVVLHVKVSKGRGLLPRFRSIQRIERGVPVHEILVSTPVRRFGVHGWLVRIALSRTIERLHREAPFTLVHVHVRTEETEQVVPIAERLSLPVVVTEHNSFYHLGIRSLPDREQQALRRHIHQWFEHGSIRRVMPVSKDLARVLRDGFGVPDERITVIPNIAAPVFRPDRPPDEGPFRIVLAALWRPPKDHDVFIKALERLPVERLANCRIDWVGSGPDMDRIVHRCRAALPGADIRFPGLLPKEALAELMRSAHVFILPTTADNLPCVVLESLCCGTPVISMAVNGLPELIDASNGILVPPSDPAALAEAMLRCITLPGVFDRKAIAEAARKRYSADAVRAAILHVYSEIEHA